MRDLRLQLVLHQCFLNLQFPAMARSIAPLINQHDRSEAEAAELVRMFADLNVAYDRYTRKKAGQCVSIEEACRRVCEGLVGVMDGEFFPSLDRKEQSIPAGRKEANILVEIVFARVSLFERFCRPNKGWP